MEFAAKEQALRESGQYPWSESERRGGVMGWLTGARQRSRDVTESATHRVREAREGAGEYIHRYPFSTVALALAVGFAAGVLVARR